MANNAKRISQRKLIVAIAVSVIVGATGTILIFSSRAATVNVLVETESSLRRGPVGRYSDSTASNGRYIEFYDATRYAAGHVYGYLWSDGSNLDTAPFYRTTIEKKADRFLATAQRMAQDIPGARAVKLEPWPYDNPNDKSDDLYYRVRLDGFGLSIPLNDIPLPVKNGSLRDKQAFVMSVLEGEGEPRGLVIDDPSYSHVSAFKNLLSQIGVSTYYALYDKATDSYSRFTGTEAELRARSFFWLMVEPESIATLQDLPYAASGRVPR